MTDAMMSENNNSLLLADEEEARRFCRTFLIPYHRPRILQCSARNKYAEGKLSKGLLILERMVVKFKDDPHSNSDNHNTALEDDFIREIKKMQVLAAAGLYTDRKKNNMRVQENWMVVYVTAYPLDEEDASDAFVAKVIEMRNNQRKMLANADMNNTNTNHTPRMINIHGKILSCLHSSPCKNRFLKLDVDTKEQTLIQQLYHSLTGANIIIAVETRGGYHVILEKGPFCRQLYELERHVNKGVPAENHWLTIESDKGPMLAIPGTNQGGFTVKLATEDWKAGIQGSISD